MPRNSRCVLQDVPYHVTQRGTNRQTVFYSAGDRRTYLNLVRDNLADAGVRVLAYCLMTNHVHWVVVPEREDSLATLFRRVHGRYAQAFNARRNRSGHLWQNRFFSCPLEADRLWVALRYVERNPVRALLAASPGDYDWSSGRAHLTGAAEEDARSAHLLRRCTYAGRPFGSEEFVGEIEEKLGRKWRRWSFEQVRPQSAVS